MNGHRRERGQKTKRPMGGGLRNKASMPKKGHLDYDFRRIKWGWVEWSSPPPELLNVPFLFFLIKI